MTEPRRPLAARAAPPFEIATRAGSLAAPAVHVVAPPPPAVAARSVPLAPAVALAPPGPPLAPACATAVAPLEPPAVVAERPHAVVVETAAGEVALAIEAVSARATLEAPRCRSRAAALVPPAVRKGSLEPVSSIRLEPIDASTLSQERLRSLLTRLWRASGAASPGELQLVGIYPRVPGGAIGSIAQAPDGAIVLRVAPRAKARPALLAVGRRRADGALVPVEDVPLDAT